MSEAQPKSFIRRRIMPWFFILLSLYIVYCGLLFFFQTKLIFPAGMAGEPGKALPTPQTEVIELPTEQGTTVAWLVPPVELEEDNPAPLVVFFHGNAELIDHQRAIINLYHDLGIGVLMVEYRGYGHSEGTPSQEHIVADTLAVLKIVLKRDDVDASRLILHGRSIGGGLGAQVALQTDPAALIVESTFTSVSGMAMRFGVPPFIVTSPLKTESAFKQLACPILIMHGQRDSVIPTRHARDLETAASDATLVLFDAGHNDLPNGIEVGKYRSQVHDHLMRAGVFSK
ncbi:MAG: alpha/beta hydrolase [Planctomycetota bacterium]